MEQMMMWITVMLLCKVADSTEIYDVSQPNPMIIAQVGDNVTLQCYQLIMDTSRTIVWYKQKAGQEPRVMATVLQQPTYENEFKSQRFSIEREEGSFHLNITNVELSDEAVYYCASKHFLTKFGKGTYLSVKGDGDVKVSVIQSGVLDLVPAGSLVTLQCSVLSDSRTEQLQVLWFRAAPSQSHPQIIYTHHNSSHQCESDSSTTHTCVYNFTKNIFSVNDTGTYYCAVTMCGKIIFGNGTQVDLRTPLINKESALDSVVVVLTVALGVCVFLILTLIFVITCKGRNMVRLNQGSVIDKTLNQDCDNVELNYAALHFNERTGKRGRGKKQQPQDILYSDVRCASVN